MSTLVLVLAAAMVVPGSGPEKMSGEMEQGLDLRGEWEWLEGFGADPLSPALFTDSDLLCLFDILDEGAGKLRLKYAGGSYLGIYADSEGGVMICCREASEGRPTSFRAGDGQHLLILNRVKPRK